MITWLVMKPQTPFLVKRSLFETDSNLPRFEQIWLLSEMVMICCCNEVEHIPHDDFERCFLDVSIWWLTRKLNCVWYDSVLDDTDPTLRGELRK
jgi:hypothetical protein